MQIWVMSQTASDTSINRRHELLWEQRQKWLLIKDLVMSWTASDKPIYTLTDKVSDTSPLTPFGKLTKARQSRVGLTSHSTHYRWFLGQSSQPISWLHIAGILYRSNDITNSVIALKDEDGRLDQASIPPGPHDHVTIIQHIICSIKRNRKECM